MLCGQLLEGYRVMFLVYVVEKRSNKLLYNDSTYGLFNC